MAPDAAARSASDNVCELVRAFGDTQPQTRALVDKRTGREVTFGRLLRNLDETAASLRAAGVRPGDRVALFVATGIEFVTLAFACYQAGAVPVLIDPGMGAKNVLACVKEQAPRVLVGIPKAHVLRILGGLAFKSVEVKLVVNGWFPGARSLSSVHGTDESVAPANSADTAAILYTSGSTGAPKGVIYTHGMIAGQVRGIRDMFNIQPGDVDVACFLPFGAFSVAMGMTAVFPDMDFRFPAKADPERILAAVQGATSAFASPALWEPFSHFLERRNVALSNLKRVLTAGAPVPPALHERMLKHLPDGDVFTPYGATEALPVSFMSGRAVVQETAALTRTGRGTCVGALAPGIDVRIVGVTDNALTQATPLPQESIGEIVVRGPCVTQAYDNRPDANRLSKIPDGAMAWHRMGDVGYLDDKGRLWFCGRKSQRVTKAAGVMLTSIPVEAVAETVWPARAALVGVGAPGEQRAILVLERVAGVDTTKVPAVVAALKANAACKGVDAVTVFTGAFPVDRRHNAKIEREALARWVASAKPTELAL